MIGKIFYYNDEYSKIASWCNENDCHIEEIDSDNFGRRFTVRKNEKMAIEDVLRQRREEECFPIINRGQLWYEGLTELQTIELKQWYQDWLDCTETRIAPERLKWIKN